jgi:hypothetical protein
MRCLQKLSCPVCFSSVLPSINSSLLTEVPIIVMLTTQACGWWAALGEHGSARDQLAPSSCDALENKGEVRVEHTWEGQ